jgi:type I site-specific restriction-modification system R (restriction) subunit
MVSQTNEQALENCIERSLVQAARYEPGIPADFDEPLLHTMYVDKKLQSVLAVQTLSRLNRSNDKMGKADTFILDFFNSVEDIRQAFEPFYTATSLSQATDVNVLHDLKEDLDGLAVYEQPEVEQFNELFFSNADADQLSPLIDLAADRFNTELDLDDIPKIDFKIKAKQFVKTNFQSQFVSNQDEQNRRIALEQLIQSAINQERRRELDLYKRYASDPEFKRAFDASIMNLLSRTDPQQFQDL